MSEDTAVPLLTLPLHQALMAARAAGGGGVEGSLDLGRSIQTIVAGMDEWEWRGRLFPFAEVCKDRTIYFFDGESFQPVARFGQSLIKLVPTEWGAPTFEIDGIKMLPTSQLSPYEDARRKVERVQPRGKVVLDTCGGLGYFASWCLQQGAVRILSFEKNPDVLWLRSLNPWSPDFMGATHEALSVTNDDVSLAIAAFDDASVDAILHDPPRFGIAGELYSQAFYDQLARVLKPRGRLFHYTGAPNRLTSRRDVPGEVSTRLQRAGFTTERVGDGILAVKNARR